MTRAASIVRGYGLTAVKIDGALKHFATILDSFGCGATFPITSRALGRNAQLIRAYQEQGIEFAIHGYRHIDYCQLGREEQQTHLALARALFDSVGIQVHGFRGPYLHANEDTISALRDQGLTYDSSQALAWDVLDGSDTSAYRHVLGFYGALSANDYPSVPDLDGDFVRIPYSLPDDEALVHRLSTQATDQMTAVWLGILCRSYQLGELFTLGLHPERTFACQEPLTAVLSSARQLDPPVWIARLSEIATWWQSRTAAEVEIRDTIDGKLCITVIGPDDTTVLVRAVEVDASTVPWLDGYRQVKAMAFTTCSPLRPFVGLSPHASPRLVSFLRQQGYIIEISEERDRYPYYFDQADFALGVERSLLAQIESLDYPLVRLGRWPNGARSALAITGDIDALTLWDYGLRFLGR